jgi:hypothetical protein
LMASNGEGAFPERLVQDIRSSVRRARRCVNRTLRKHSVRAGSRTESTAGA